MDDTGKCVADQGGFADALQFMADLKAAGATFETDGGKADTLFRQGQADMIINGPWTLGDYKKDLGDKLGVAPMPAGPKGAATPLAGVDCWYVNPNSKPEQQKLAAMVALYLFGAKGAQIYADVAGSPMVAHGCEGSRSAGEGLCRCGSRWFPAAAEQGIRQLVGAVRRCSDQGHGRQVRPRGCGEGSLRGHEQGQRQVVKS